MKKLTSMDMLAVVVVAIAGVNYLIVGLFGLNFIDEASVAGRFIYAIFGLCALYIAAMSKPVKK